MPDLSTLLPFTAAALALIVVPGPAVLYVVAQSIDRGRLAGVVSVLGIGVGALVHVAAAAVGLSALLVSSALAFSVVKYLGAAYLIVLGVRQLLARNGEAAVRLEPERRTSHLFWQGVVVNALNPKTAIFFLAFLPQFVDVSNGAVALQIVVLGFLFILLGFLSDGIWALLAGSLAGWLRGSRRFLRVQRYVSGSVLVGLGVATAASGSGKVAK